MDKHNKDRRDAKRTVEHEKPTRRDMDDPIPQPRERGGKCSVDGCGCDGACRKANTDQNGFHCPFKY